VGPGAARGDRARETRARCACLSLDTPPLVPAPTRQEMLGGLAVRSSGSFATFEQMENKVAALEAQVGRRRGFTLRFTRDVPNDWAKLSFMLGGGAGGERCACVRAAERAHPACRARAVLSYPIPQAQSATALAAPDSLERQFAALEGDSGVEGELAALKREPLDRGRGTCCCWDGRMYNWRGRDVGDGRGGGAGGAEA
jgi:hypothetical protein